MLGNKKIMGDNIQYYLSMNGIERKEFAKIIGVPYSTLTCWINGTAYPRIDKIQKMADYFGIEKRDLVEERIVQGVVEIALLQAFRKADPTTQAIILKILGIEKR